MGRGSNDGGTADQDGGSAAAGRPGGCTQQGSQTSPGVGCSPCSPCNCPYSPCSPCNCPYSPCSPCSLALARNPGVNTMDPEKRKRNSVRYLYSTSNYCATLSQLFNVHSVQ